MHDELDIHAWMETLTAELATAFGDRLVFVGLQGSRARGEAREGSDIDAVVIIQGLTLADLGTYRKVLSTLPCADIACGFVSSPDVLAHWPRSDSFNLVMDAAPHYGSLDFMDARFTADEAEEAAKSGASGIYHAVCHGMLFDGDALSDIVGACVKSAFFVMRARTFAETGEYPRSRARMKELATNQERVFLDAYDDPTRFAPSRLAQELMTWSSKVMTQESHFPF